MGGWNGTCGLSQLPIYEGQPVMGFLVKESNLKRLMGGGDCYARDLFAPMTPAIKGCYTGDGEVKQIENEALILPFIQSFFEQGRLKFDETSGEEFPMDFRELSLEQWLHLVEREAIYAEERNFITKEVERLNVGMMMVIPSVFETLAQTPQMTEEMVIFKEEIRSQQEMVKEFQGFTHLHVFDTTFHRAAYHLKSYWQFYLKTEDETLYQALLQTEALEWMLQQLRKFWMPQSGVGSQDDHTLFKPLLEGMTRYMRKCEKEWEL